MGGKQKILNKEGKLETSILLCTYIFLVAPRPLSKPRLEEVDCPFALAFIHFSVAADVPLGFIHHEVIQIGSLRY